MYVGIVVGSVVATTKDEALIGKKLLIVQEVDTDGRKQTRTEVAVDSVGAGTGEYVLVTNGGSARNVFDSASTIDAAIVAIVDSMELSG